jgi:lipoyl(octanoyl) transferase
MSRGAYCMSLGLVSYGEAFALQRSLAGAVSQGAIPETVILLEHPPVITVGRRTEADRELHIPAGADVEIAETDRGGKSTFHGPGQLVCYPILDLKNHGKDVKLYVRNLEEALIRTLATFDLDGVRFEGLTGVWMPPRRREPVASSVSLASGGGRDSADARPVRQSEVQRRERSAEPGSARREPSAAGGGGGPRKIASIGVHVSRWVTTHGYALNVDLDPAPFTDWITACGLEDAAFTTMARELDRPVAVEDVRPAAVAAIAEVFELELEELPADEGAGLWPQSIHASLAAR